jgi:hypothetical protein
MTSYLMIRFLSTDFFENGFEGVPVTKKDDFAVSGQISGILHIVDPDSLIICYIPFSHYVEYPGPD